MNTDDALLAVIDAGTSILLGTTPLIGREGYSTIANSRIKRLAEAVRDLREALGMNQATEGDKSENSISQAILYGLATKETGDRRMTDECRKVFEGWAIRNYHNTSRNERTGFYANQTTVWAWDAWQAAWNTRTSPTPPAKTTIMHAANQPGSCGPFIHRLEAVKFGPATYASSGPNKVDPPETLGDAATHKDEEVDSSTSSTSPVSGQHCVHGHYIKYNQCHLCSSEIPDVMRKIHAVIFRWYESRGVEKPYIPMEEIYQALRPYLRTTEPKAEQPVTLPTICGFCKGLDGRHYQDCTVSKPEPVDLDKAWEQFKKADAARKEAIKPVTSNQPAEMIVEAVEFALINAEPFSTEEVIRVAVAKLNGNLPLERKPVPVSVSLEKCVAAMLHATGSPSADYRFLEALAKAVIESLKDHGVEVTYGE